LSVGLRFVERSTGRSNEHEGREARDMANLHPWKRSGNTIDFVQHVNAEPSDVWAHFTDEALILKWIKVSTATIPEVEGAPFLLSAETEGRSSGDEVRAFRGTVKKVIPNRLLALEWVLPHSGEKTQFSLQIQQSFSVFGQDRGPECDIWIIHSGFPTEGMGLFEFDGHSRHWRQGIGDLVALLEDRPGKPTPYSLAGLLFAGGAPGKGLYVSDCVAGGPADEAGIRPGDLIRAVDGNALESLDDFHDWIDERHPGESGVFTLQDRSVVVTVTDVEEIQRRFLLIREGKPVATR
jgi:uncharacterized protein YndB with AHSA1/START domain